MNDFGMSHRTDDGTRDLARAAVKLGALGAASMIVGVALDPRWLHVLTGDIHPFWFILASTTTVAALAAWTGAAARGASRKGRTPGGRRRLELLGATWYAGACISMAFAAIFALAPPAQQLLHTLWLTGLPYGSEMHPQTRYGVQLASALTKVSAAGIIASLSLAAVAWQGEKDREAQEP